MRRLIECQIAVTPWGSKAIFRRARIGLLRRGSTIYIAIFLNANNILKFPIDEGTELLPAAIRFNRIGKDLFIRHVSDQQLYVTMVREMKVILRRDKVRQSGKGEALEKLISSIPTVDSHDYSPRLSVRISGGLETMPKSLHELTLTDCNLNMVPKQLETFSTLRSLDLSKNRIDNLPRSFCCKMTNLEVLNLSNNLIKSLPIEIKFFSRLTDLNISDNHLRILPSTFSDLRSLRRLNVAKNNLSQLPAFRSDEIRLKYLDVSYNPLDGALDEVSLFEVHPSSVDDSLDYQENRFCPFTSNSDKKLPKLFEIAMLKVVRCNSLLKLASEEPLPRTIVSVMQRDIFKCYRCNRMNILPAYNSTDILDYVDQVEILTSTGNYRYGMTFMKLLCRECFDSMRS